MKLSEEEVMVRLVEKATAEVIKRTYHAADELRRSASMGYLSQDELAELIDCKPNERLKMIRWLTASHWNFVVGIGGSPRVARVYYDRKMGISSPEEINRQTQFHIR